MGSFHRFPLLPTEVRIRIWQHTVEPRIVKVSTSAQPYIGPLSALAASHNYFWRLKTNRITDSTQVCLYLKSSTPVPAVLQVSREPRNLGLYQQVQGTYLHIEPPEHRYVYVNWDLDVIDIGAHLVGIVSPFKDYIQRLCMERRNEKGWAEIYDWPGLAEFKSIRELSIICLDGLFNWRNGTKQRAYPCSAEQVYYVDPDTGRSASAAMVEAYLAATSPGDEQRQGQSVEDRVFTGFMEGKGYSRLWAVAKPGLPKQRTAISA